MLHHEQPNLNQKLITEVADPKANHSQNTDSVFVSLRYTFLFLSHYVSNRNGGKSSRRGAAYHSFNKSSKLN